MDRLIDTIGGALVPLGFRAHHRAGMDGLGVIASWRRCTWNTNRAVAVVRRPEGHLDLRAFCQGLKWKLLRQTRSIPFIYEVGLQLVVVGDGLGDVIEDPAQLRGVVDLLSNQFVVLQSVFVADESTKIYSCERTWGQYVTGRFQDAIADGIKAAGFAMVQSE